MARSRRDGATWARVARRGGDPSATDEDAQYLTVDPDSGALIVTGAGAAPAATSLRVADGAGSGRLATVGVDGALLTRDVTAAEATVDADNFPTGPLAGGAMFVGAWQDVLPYAAITVVVFTDQASAANGAVVDFSADGVNVVRSVTASIPGGVGSYFSLAPEARFYRLRYTNGPVPQGVLRGQVLLRFQPPALVEQPLGAAITDLNLAQITRAAVTGRLPDGRYLPVAITADQRLTVQDQHTQPLTDAQLRAAPLPTAPQPLAARMLAKAPAAGHRLWLDVLASDPAFIYLAEAPAGSAEGDAVFRGVRVPLVGGAPLGAVQEAESFAWSARAGAAWT